MRFMGGDPVVPAATDAAFSEGAADVGELPERDGHRANPEAGAEETRSEHIQPPTKRRKMRATSVQGSASPAVAELAKESLEEDNYKWPRGRNRCFGCGGSFWGQQCLGGASV